MHLVLLFITSQDVVVHQDLRVILLSDVNGFNALLIKTVLKKVTFASTANVSMSAKHQLLVERMQFVFHNSTVTHANAKKDIMEIQLLVAEEQ